MVRERAVDVVTNLKGKFHELPRRKMVQLDSDLTVDDVAISTTDVENALVKIRVKHRKGDEERANETVRTALDSCKGKAYHVFRPELIVVGGEKTRMPELTVATKPMDAVNMWLDKRAPDSVDKQEIARRLEVLLSRVPDLSAREQFLPFVVRAIGGKNFQPFKGEFEVHQIPDGVFEITGRYINEEGRSNRSGKSSFLEVLLFVLEGVGRKVRSVDQYVHQGEDTLDAFVELIDHKDEQVRIDRIVKNGATSVLINGQRYSVRDANEYIRQNIVGLGVEDFVRTCFVRQDDLHGLLGQTSAEIQKDLVRWFGVGVWKHVEVLVASEQDDAEKLQYRLTVKIEELDRQIQDNLVNDNEVLRVRKDLEIAEAAVGGVDVLELQIKELQNKVVIARKVEVARNDLDHSGPVSGELQRVEIELVEVKEKVNSQAMKIGAVDSKLREAKGNLSRFDGVCPVDSGKCPRVKDINKNSTKIEKVIGNLETDKSVLQCESSELKIVRDGLDSKIFNLEKLKRIREHAQEILDEYGQDYKDESVLERELLGYREKLEGEQGSEDFKRDVRDLRYQLASLQASMKIHDNAVTNIKKARQEINRLDGDLSVLRYMRLIVGKTGIPSMQIENGVQELQAQANNVLEQVGTDHRLSFSFETELKKKATACHECGRPFGSGERKCKVCGVERGNEKSDQMSVKVTENGREHAFDQDSGGGKALLAIAVRIALARMLGAQFMACDEICASLDSENLRTYLTMLRGLASIGFRQVFDVSHRPEVAEALDKNIVITRYPDENRSTVGWE